MLFRNIHISTYMHIGTYCRYYYRILAYQIRRRNFHRRLLTNGQFPPFVNSNLRRGVGDIWVSNVAVLIIQILFVVMLIVEGTVPVPGGIKFVFASASFWRGNVRRKVVKIVASSGAVSMVNVILMNARRLLST